jgi:hypothetical protein
VEILREWLLFLVLVAGLWIAYLAVSWALFTVKDQVSWRGKRMARRVRSRYR